MTSIDHYALFGRPIRHSLSPRIHAAFATQTGQSLDYGLLESGLDTFAGRLVQFHAEGGLGGNVTLPLKGLAAEICETLSGRARRAGAVNTLLRTPSGWHGDNTDGVGFLRDLLEQLGFDPAGRRLLILGAGGAVRGLLGPLLAAAPALVCIANRTLTRAQQLAAEFGPEVAACALAPESLAPHCRPDLLINAMAAGHEGHFPELPAHLCGAGTLAYDLSYGGAARPFLAWAEAAGAGRVSDGLGMLVAQAAESFYLWRGLMPDWQPVLATLRG